MSENVQNPSFLGTTNLQLSLPVMSNAAPLTGNICSFSRESSPATSSMCVLPSGAASSFQPLMGSAYLYQEPSTPMSSGVSYQGQFSTSMPTYPGIFMWDLLGSTEKSPSSLRDLTVTVTDQNTSVSSMSMTAPHNQTSDASYIVPLYPSLSASLVQGAPSQIPNQGHNLSLPYQAGSQVYYYTQGTLGPLLSGVLGPYVQPYGSVSYTGGRGSAPQPEMVMVLQEVQPTNILPPATTSGINYSVSAQPITESHSQVMETVLGMDPSLAWPPSSQRFCLSPTPEVPKSFSSPIQILESHSPPHFGDISEIASVQGSSHLLALPPAPRQEDQESKNGKETKTKHSEPQDSIKYRGNNQDPPLVLFEDPEIHQLLDPLGPEKQLNSENTDLGEHSLSLEDQWKLECGMDSSDSFTDISTLVEDIQLPQLFSSFKDCDQPKGSSENIKDPEVIILDDLPEKTEVIPPVKGQSKKHKATESLDGPPKAKMQAKTPQCLLGEEDVICDIAASDRDPRKTTKQSTSKTPRMASGRSEKDKGHGQEKTKKTQEHQAKRPKENKQAGGKAKTEEEKTTNRRMKRRKNPPELSQEAFKKPRTCLGLHMLESVQVFHALGKKIEKKTGPSSSRPLGNTRNMKDTQPSLRQSSLDIPREGKVHEKSQPKTPKSNSGAEKERYSPSQYELPPPGKVKLVPLPFLSPDKPPARPVSRRPQSLASHRPVSAHPSRPGSTKPVQCATVNASGPTPTSGTGLVRPARPTSTNPVQGEVTNPTRPSVPHPAASRPEPSKSSSCSSLQQEPGPNEASKRPSPPRSQHQFLLHDFSRQRIPWREPDILGPVVSTPITKEQRPEREAMKRQAQRERENAAQHTALGRMQFFIEREKEMDISLYYGYVM